MKLKIDPNRASEALKERRTPVEKSGRLLIVDDEEANLQALRELLSRRYEVVATTSPDEAVRRVAEVAFDVVITDQRMPGMVGTHLLRRIIALNDDNVRVLLTGYTDVADLITCINDRLIHRYLVKPWIPEEILAVVAEALEKLQTERTMRRLVPQQIIERLYGSALREARPGHGKEVSCALFFLDIRDFTRMACDMTPEDAFAFLTSYVSCVGPIIESHHGFIDKYLGDGLLAVFDRSPTYAIDAAACAIAVVVATGDYNQRHRSGPPPQSRPGRPRSGINIGIGINSGKVMLGAVGFARRLEFTVLGDAVNTASRIQALTKYVGVEVLASDEIGAGLPPDTAARCLGNTRVRGRAEPTRLWEIFAADPVELRTRKLHTKANFDRAVTAIDAGQFEEARPLLERLIADHPDDRAARYLYDTLGR